MKIQVKFKLRAVLWNREPCGYDPDWRGVALYRHDRELQHKVAAMLRRQPNKTLRGERFERVIDLPGVRMTWG